MRTKCALILLLVFLFNSIGLTRALKPVVAKAPPQALPSAGTVSLPQTGQTTSYYAGDDGALQTGATWTTTRFNDLGDGSVIDALTGLMW
jgi:hypothetical protein